MNPFSFDTVRLPIERIVDRHDQIAFLNEHVIENYENVLVTGPFGIGKTCILRKFRGQIDAGVRKRTLIIEMEMRRLTTDASGFLSDVLLKLVDAFWEQVVQRPHTELIKALTNPADVRENLIPHVSDLLELYRIVRPKSVGANLQRSSALGVDRFLKATKEEKANRIIERGDLRPEEFVSIATELLSVLEENGKDRTIIFGDEANHIDPDIEVDMIRRNFEAFAHKGVQFVLTANETALQKVPTLKDAFPSSLAVGPFKDPKVMEEMLMVYCKDASAPRFAPRCRELIWQISAGNPREIQRLCRECTDRAIAGAATEIDAGILVQAIAKLYELRPI